MAIPSTWDNTGEKTTRPIREFINWTYNGAEDGLGAGSAKFDFRVFMFIDGDPTVETGYDGMWSANYTHKVVDISGSGRGFNSSPKPSQEQVMKEILALSWVATNPDGQPTTNSRLQRKGENVFGGDTGPVIDTITVKASGEGTGVWLMTFHASKRKIPRITQKPESGSEIPTVRDPYPWEEKPKVKLSFSTEDYKLGSGFFVGAKTPLDIFTDVIAQNGTLAALYANIDSNTPYEIIKNSAGDPFASPPSTKITLANLEITANFESNDSDLADIMNYARIAQETVNNDLVTTTIVDGTSFGIQKGMGRVIGCTLSPAEYVDKRDWLPKQKHPFEKTNGELGWTGTDYVSSEIAVNVFGRTLQATRRLAYIQLSLAISIKQLGWGEAIPDRGYRARIDGVVQEIKEKSSSSATERLLYEDESGVGGLLVPKDEPTEDLKCLRLYTTFASSDALSSLINKLPFNRVEV